MNNIYNVYCDESCHLENDHQKSMVLGAVWCLDDSKKQIFTDIRNLKRKYGLSDNFEIKWTKVSPAKIDFYLAIINYFFSNKNLHFRCLVVPDKDSLDHEKFNQTHDSWYYKMYFDLLKVIIYPDSKYRVYIDIKDTNGGTKIKKLHEVLSNNIYDFNRDIIERLQIVKSDEIELIQLADLLIGAMSFLSRDEDGSSAKKEIIQKIKEKSGYELNRSTLVQEEKFNILIWRAS